MNTYVLDTSVTLAWYLDEAFSASARQWQERLLAGKVILLVPSLHYWEFGNALRSLVIRKEIPEALARDIYELHSEAPLENAEPSASRVLDTALEYRSTAYDAVYISLSLERSAPLITAERKSTPWVAKLGDLIEHVAK